MNNTIKTAGVDIDFSKAIKKANQGKSIVIPSTENGKPVLSCWNIPKNSVARKQLQEIARKFGKRSVRFYSIKKGHILVVI